MPQHHATLGAVLGATVGAVVAAAALAACSSSGPAALFTSTTSTPSQTRTTTRSTTPSSTSTTPRTTATTTTSTTATTTAPSSSTPASSEPGSSSALAGALLAVTDLGGGYRSTASAPASPLPCTPNDPPVDQQVANVEKGEVTYSDGTVVVGEQLYVYDSEAAAVRHQMIDEHGLGCSSGSLGGAHVDIAGPIRLEKELGTASLDRAEAWPVSTSTVNGELILVRINGVVVQFSFVAPRTSHPKLDVKQVIQTGVQKVLAAAR